MQKGIKNLVRRKPQQNIKWLIQQFWVRELDGINFVQPSPHENYPCILDLEGNFPRGLPNENENEILENL